MDTSGQVVTLLRDPCQSNFSCVNTALCKHLGIVKKLKKFEKQLLV